MKEISAKEKKSFTLPWRDETWKFYQMYRITMKMKGLGARTLQFSFKQIFSIENDDAAASSCKGWKNYLTSFIRANKFQCNGAKILISIWNWDGKKETNFAILTRSQKATTERITQNGVGEEKSLIWWAFKYHYDFSSYNYYHPNNRSSCSRGSLKFHCIPPIKTFSF